MKWRKAVGRPDCRPNPTGCRLANMLRELLVWTKEEKAAFMFTMAFNGIIVVRMVMVIGRLCGIK